MERVEHDLLVEEAVGIVHGHDDKMCLIPVHEVDGFRCGCRKEDGRAGMCERAFEAGGGVRAVLDDDRIFRGAVRGRSL
ncbi:hypothetical protein U8Q05_20275 [Rhizobium ruizarguesonis]|nr:hypothetical protein U8Q05_20275 [Rhizobium ruizarguesonis]